jgi:mannosyltransferase OCH1-like enzyme
MSKIFHKSTFDFEATDDKLRSRHIQQLVHRMDQGVISNPDLITTRILVQYWDDSDIPSDVQRCLDSWHTTEYLGFERLIFDKEQARAFIEHYFSDTHLRAFDSCIHPAMRSDYFRLCFLLRKGGLYVDADDELQEPESILPLMNTGLLHLQPLCYRLSTDSMVVPANFVDEVSDDLIFYVNNDPIIAPANHPIIQAALAQATDRLINAGSTSRDIQWLAGPGNLSEVLVRHSLQLDTNDAQLDFQLIYNWTQTASVDWTLDYRKDDRNWRLWVAGNTTQ